MLTADMEQLIRDGCAERGRLSSELREKVKKLGETDASIKKSLQVKFRLKLTICLTFTAHSHQMYVVDISPVDWIWL